MREKRRSAATSLTTQGMLVSGGGNYDDGYLSSTEYYAGGQWVRGPEMPVEMGGHCQVTVGETVIVTGNIRNISILVILGILVILEGMPPVWYNYFLFL